MTKRFGAPEDRPRVLIVSPQAPWPMHGGGAIRTASIVEYFAARAAVDLIVFREEGEPDTPAPPNLLARLDYIDIPRHRRDPLSRLPRNVRRLAGARPPLVDRFSGFSRELQHLLLVRHYDLGIIEHFWCAPYADLLRPSCDRLWIDLHNIESDWHESLARRSRAPVRLALDRFAHACRELERDLLPRFDLALVTSEQDRARVLQIATGLPTVIYPNALPFIPTPTRLEREEIVFTGNLEYAPNIDAVRFFYRDIWPAVRHAHPSLRWRIVGQNPGAIRHIVAGDPQIEIVGPVNDAIAEIARAKVSVVPLLAGSGTRLKILEAWAAGTPVVSTTLGAQGLDATPGVDLRIADSPRAFAETISGLLSSSDQRLSLSASGRRLFERRYTWNSAWRELPSPFPAISKTVSLYTG